MAAPGLRATEQNHQGAGRRRRGARTHQRFGLRRPAARPALAARGRAGRKAAARTARAAPAPAHARVVPLGHGAHALYGGRTSQRHPGSAGPCADARGNRRERRSRARVQPDRQSYRWRVRLAGHPDARARTTPLLPDAVPAPGCRRPGAAYRSATDAARPGFARTPARAAVHAAGCAPGAIGRLRHPGDPHEHGPAGRARRRHGRAGVAAFARAGAFPQAAGGRAARSSGTGRAPDHRNRRTRPGRLLPQRTGAVRDRRAHRRAGRRTPAVRTVRGAGALAPAAAGVPEDRRIVRPGHHPQPRQPTAGRHRHPGGPHPGHTSLCRRRRRAGGARAAAGDRLSSHAGGRQRRLPGASPQLDRRPARRPGRRRGQRRHGRPRAHADARHRRAALAAP
ncbi:Uncharacterised protein [Bordetella pertussis]|nr:Uncharacterised protein [Bordetella pertussis]CPM26237.1 Uncharacterised protein [Bordetella pertussis]